MVNFEHETARQLASDIRSTHQSIDNALADLASLTFSVIDVCRNSDAPPAHTQAAIEGVANGLTMMVDARIVFLDEVGAGVNRTLLNTIGDAIVRLNKERGYTFCVIEHDMDFIGRLCDPVICMAEGKVLAEGTVEEVKNDERVIEVYLGRKSKTA